MHLLNDIGKVHEKARIYDKRRDFNELPPEWKTNITY
jgi:hypothetical protein